MRGQTPPLAPAQPAATKPEYAATQEVRFALVLYGGVSLAIYINGVAQEFLSLVRATAPEPPDEHGDQRVLVPDGELTGTERVYRRLGQMLAFGPDSAPPPGDAVTTRFVVDVISGSSAGGLNGIYLGKALANEQSIRQLRDLWIDEGDIGLLVNDRDSYAGVGSLRPAGPPESLLNGRRMYWKLLSALDGMDAKPAVDRSRLVDALDVWITTTDLRGLVLPIQLADALVYEPRHRNVLHFSYADPDSSELSRRDFRKELNPLLAFAARATSSFPFAFEPTTLDDIDEFMELSEFQEYAESSSRSSTFHEFFDDYVRGRRRDGDSRDPADYYRSDAFADGGYLDNKPFGWAIESITKRRADLPVVRYLAYVEPSPSTTPPSVPNEQERNAKPPPWNPPTERPDILENSLAAAYGLPRSEAIRDDIERVLARNREVGRARQIARLVDKAAQSHPELMWKLRPIEEWLALTYNDLTQDFGLGYAAYHRLKLARVFDDLASYVAAAYEFVGAGDEQAALRLLVEAWFEETYGEENGGRTHTRFLYRFDLGYRLRRLRYVSIRIQEVLRFDQDANAFLRRFPQGAPNPRVENEDDARAELRRLKLGLNRIRATLLRTDQRLRTRAGATHPLNTALDDLGITREDLLGVLEPPRSDAGRLDAATKLLRAPELGPRLDALAAELGAFLDRVLVAARRTAAEQLRGDRSLPRDARRARTAVRFIYDQYENYDFVSFPHSYGLVENATQVDVIRISPQDATSLIDETSPRDGRHKLAGDQLGHFGGFVDRSWRRNDLLWGRLDTAERIIKTLLPPSKARRRLLEKAQLAIIEEEFELQEQGPLVDVLAASMLSGGPPPEETLTSLVGRDKLAEALTSSLAATAIRTHLKKRYEYSKAVDNHRLLGVAGRATRVTGQVFDGLSERTRSPARWLVRAGRFGWWLSEITTPRSMRQVLTSYWVALLLLLSVVLIVGGTLVGWPEATRVGWVLLALIAGGRLLTLILGDLLAGRVRLALVAAVTAALALLGLAVVEVVVHGAEDLDRVGGQVGDAVRDIGRTTHPSYWELRIPAILALAAMAVVLAAFLSVRGRKSVPVHRLEFVETAGDVEKLVGPLGDERRKKVQHVLRVDYAFIAAYTAFFVALAALLALYDESWTLWVAVPIAIAALLGGLLDVLENRQISKVLRLRSMDMTPLELSDLRWWARAKWFVMSLVVGALSLVFFLGDDKLLSAVGMLWAFLGLVGMLGSVWRRGLLQVFLAVTLVAAIGACAAVLFGLFDDF